MELRRGPFDIEVDGRSVGSIAGSQTFETPLEPGRHTLRIRSGRYSSQQCSLDVDDHDVVAFRTYGANLWPIFVVSIVKTDLGISLKRE